MTDSEGSSTLRIDSGATVGVAYDEGSEPPDLDSGHVRSGTVIYDDVSAGPGLQTGHHALVREYTDLGANCLVGTHAVIDGATVVGDAVSIQTGAYVPRETALGDRVFLGPNATLLNDRYPVREAGDLRGPTLERDVSIGANATILPDVVVGEGAFVAAGAVVTESVPAEALAVGVPAEHRPLPDELQGGNDL